MKIQQYLYISIDIEVVVLRGENDGPVLHEGNIEALGVLDFTLKSTKQLTSLAEHGEVEIVVVVSYGDFPRCCETNTNGEV